MTVRLFTVKGMGGTFGLFDSGILDVRREVLSISGVKDGGVFTFPQRDVLLAECYRARQRGERIAIVGHSLGCVTACSVTDYMPVDLLALYDTAGAAPSKLGKNTALALDFADAAASVAPDFRPQAVAGYESRIRRYRGSMGHVQCAFNPQWRSILIDLIRRLASR